MDVKRGYLHTIRGICDQLSIALAAFFFLSAFLMFGAGLRIFTFWFESGEFSVLWKYDEYTWAYNIGVGIDTHEPSLSFGAPSLEETGMVGVAGWKTRDWRLRLPLWPLLAAAVLSLLVARRWTGALWSWHEQLLLLRRFVGMTLGILVCLTIATAVSFAAQNIPESYLWLDIILRVLVPLALGALPATYLYRRIAPPHRRFRPGLCQQWRIQPHG